MSSFNKVILIGRLTRDPELRYTPNGNPVVNFTLAVNRRRSSSGSDKETDFIDIVAWQKLAEVCANYLNKGKLVVVEGRLQIRSYETNEGQRRRVAEVVASDMRMLDRRPREEEGIERESFEEQKEEDISMDEIPF